MSLNSVQLLAVELAVAVIGLLLGYKCFSLKKDNMDSFRRFVVILNAFLLVNIPIRCVELHLVQWNRTFVFWMYALSIVLMTYTMAYWYVFSLRQLDSRLVNSVLKRHLSMVPATLVVPLCIVNYWTGWLYYIDESSWYNRGSIFVLQAAISYAYFIIIGFSHIYYLIVKKDKETVRRCGFAVVPVVIGSALQIIFGGSYTPLGMVLCAWIMYIEIALNQQKAYEVSEAVQSIKDELVISNKEVADSVRTILALSGIYSTLFEVNFENDTFTEIKAPEIVSKFSAKYRSAKKCMKAMPDALFDPGYAGVVKTILDPDLMNQSLRNKNSFFVDAIGNFSRSWIRVTVLVTARDESGKVSHVVFTLQDIGDIVEQKKKLEEAGIYEIHAQEMQEMFAQTAEALVSAIDAKDKYTRGHSIRVAKYAREIAKMAGMSDTECQQIYFAGLLHDVGKIGISDAIICKEGKLTDEEYGVIKTHPELGNDILKKISRLPYLCIGANSHHERFDGKGYPNGLKGEEIPDMARIIAVADAYDAMTSKRSYRNPIPQESVREEIVKGMGTQFDPDFAKFMIQLIDRDLKYNMKETNLAEEDEGLHDLACGEFRSNYSHAIRIMGKTRIHFNYKNTGENCMPVLVFFDALDGRVHKGDKYEQSLFYHEYGEVKLDGSYVFNGVRKTLLALSSPDADRYNECDMELIKDGDHIYFDMQANGKRLDGTIALPDNTRYVYVSLTGENCFIYDIQSSYGEEKIEKGTIPRIVDEISYLNGIEGNIPSIQVDGSRSASTEGVLLEDDLQLEFDMKSLPFARLIWHCPFVIIYHSADGQINGEDYKEYALVRLNGESDSELDNYINQIVVEKTEEFTGWDQWRMGNIEGRHCTVSLYKTGSQILLKTSNGGIDISNMTTLDNADEKIYVALTGDQCVIENIHASIKNN